MKTTVRVVVLVDVTHETVSELCEAVKDLKARPPHRDTTVAGDFGAYTARTRNRAASVVKVGGR